LVFSFGYQVNLNENEPRDVISRDP
jgi:hypothetical protein